jgi:hypothetical protein
MYVCIINKSGRSLIVVISTLLILLVELVSGCQSHGVWTCGEDIFCMCVCS